MMSAALAGKEPPKIMDIFPEIYTEEEIQEKESRELEAFMINFAAGRKAMTKD